MRSYLLALSIPCAMGMAPTVSAQLASEKLYSDVVAQIKEEGMQRSKVMDTISFLTDVHGPRLTASNESRIAGNWTVEKLKEWGLQNAHLETWGPLDAVGRSTEAP